MQCGQGDCGDYHVNGRSHGGGEKTGSAPREIERCIAEALPERKAKVERKLQAKEHMIAVVGGAIHASPVLAEDAVGMFVHI
jgi:high-affinity K+ transport system ATPase subunit B